VRRIPVLNRQRRYRISQQSVACFCAALLESLEKTCHSVSVVFVSARQIRSMNRHYLGRDYATDVLSFSYGLLEVEGVPYLGEVVIAPEIAFARAIRCGVSPERELRKLLVHGALHLLGYDHETDQGQMNRLQTKLLNRKFFLNSPRLAG